MGYSRKDVEEALLESKYNDVMATYLLLSRKVTEVCRRCYAFRLVCCLFVYYHLLTFAAVNRFCD